MNMKYLSSDADETTDPSNIARSLTSGLDYKPDWRFQIVQIYLAQLRGVKKVEPGAIEMRWSRAQQHNSQPLRQFDTHRALVEERIKNKVIKTLNEVLEKEPDPIVRQLTLHSHNGTSIIAEQIEYALRANRSQTESVAVGLIKAQIVCDRTAEQIARTVGTTAAYMNTFEKIFFDVRRYLGNRVWLQSLWFPSLSSKAPIYLQSQARLMQIAFRGGWRALYPYICEPTSSSSKPTPQALISGLFSRAQDHVHNMEIRGTPPSDADIQRLVAVQRAVKLAGIPITAADLADKEPLEPEQEKKLQETRAKAAALPLPVRKKLRQSLESHIAGREKTAPEIAAEEERARPSVPPTVAANPGTMTSAENATTGVSPVAMVGTETTKIGPGENAAWVIFFSRPAASPITVNYFVSGDTNGCEQGQIIIPSGQQSATVTKQFPSVPGSAEPNEVTLFLWKGIGYKIGNPDNATLCIWPNGTATLGSI
jgi:hypothetical protein